MKQAEPQLDLFASKTQTPHDLAKRVREAKNTARRKSYSKAASERDEGIERAFTKAEKVDPGWSDRAVRWIEAYARSHKQFISEECTAEAAQNGLESPADPRAWGQPFKSAAREGIIKRAGYGTSTRRHLSPTPLWESQICRS